MNPFVLDFKLRVRSCDLPFPCQNSFLGPLGKICLASKFPTILYGHIIYSCFVNLIPYGHSCWSTFPWTLLGSLWCYTPKTWYQIVFNSHSLKVGLKWKSPSILCTLIIFDPNEFMSHNAIKFHIFIFYFTSNVFTGILIS